MRPAKSAKTLTENSQTKEEIRIRIENEEKLRGGTDLIIPPEQLTENQKYIFNFIVSELKASEILGNLDLFLLVQTVIAIDRVQEIEFKINKNPKLIYVKEVMSVKDKYMKDFFRGCNELSLSPQSRAKLSNINMQTKANEEDPLLKLLNGVGQW